MPIALVNRRMNPWFSTGIRTFDMAARRESDDSSGVLIAVKGSDASSWGSAFAGGAGQSLLVTGLSLAFVTNFGPLTTVINVGPSVLFRGSPEPHSKLRNKS